MKKKLTILIVAVVTGLTIIGVFMVSNNISITPEQANQQKSKTEKKMINSEVTKGKTCEDSDGLDYYTKGNTKNCDFETYEEAGATSPVGCTLHEDFCPTGKELYEYYCEGDDFKFKKYSCPNGCHNGTCIK